MYKVMKLILYTSDVETKKNHSLSRLEIVKGNVYPFGEIQWEKDGSYQVTAKTPEVKLLIKDRIRELLEQGVEQIHCLRQANGVIDDLVEIVKFPDERFILLLSDQFSRSERVRYQGSPIIVEPEEDHIKRVQAIKRGYVSTKKLSPSHRSYWMYHE